MADEPIVKFFIQNYTWNGSVVSTETLFQTIPINGIPAITSPKVKNEMGKAGSFEFGLERNSPYYNAMIQMKTIMRVTYFGQTIFRGRVLTIDKTMARTRQVHCEGDFAFLLDSPQPGTKEDARPKITVNEYLQQIITAHNSYINGDNIKKFVLGEVPGQYTGNTETNQRVVIPSEKAVQKFGDTSWNSTMDRIEGILSIFGGYFRTRYDSQSGNTYLDWYDKYYSSTNDQTIEVSRNLIDISGPTEIENLFTIVIPIGKKDGNDIYISDYWPIVQSGHAKVPYITVPELASVPLYSDSQLNSIYHSKSDYANAITKYGKIWKPVSFENANTPELLFSYAKDWIKDNFVTEITQWSVTALDMKIVDSDSQMLLCGDRVKLVHPEVPNSGNVLTIISAEYDLYNPEKNKYTIGIPSQQLNASYGVKNAKSKKSSENPVTNPSTKISQDKVETELEQVKRRVETLYSMKTDWHQDIGIDGPAAYVMYNTDGTKKDEKQARKGAIDLAEKLSKTLLLHGPEIMQEAARRGVSKWDTQLLIDYTADEKLKQTQFKAQSESNFVAAGLNHQQAAVVLNETAGQSWLASLVDDSGEWTEYALSQGAMAWLPQIKQQAISARKLLKGEETVPAADSFFNYKEYFSGSNLNLSNYLNFDADNLTFDIGSIFNTEEITNAVTGLTTKAGTFLGGLISGNSQEKSKTSGTGTWENIDFSFLTNLFTGNNTESGGLDFAFLTDLFTGSDNGTTKEFNLESDTAQVDGSANGGGIGLGGSGSLDGWTVTLNKPLTYTSGGHSYTVPAGSVAADDFHFTATYDSLKVKLLVVDTLLADYAKINTLEALKAQIDNITGNTIKANTYVRSEYGYFTNLYGSNIYSTGGVYYTNSNAQNIDLKKCYNQCVLTGPDSNNKYTLTMYPADGSTPRENYDIVTFSRAVTSWTKGWSDGTFTAKANPQNQSTTTTITGVTAGTVNHTAGSKYIYSKFSVTADSGPTGYTSGDVYLDASDVYDDCYGTVKISNAGTSGYIDLGYSGSETLYAQAKDLNGTYQNISGVTVRAPARPWLYSTTDAATQGNLALGTRYKLSVGSSGSAMGVWQVPSAPAPTVSDWNRTNFTSSSTDYGTKTRTLSIPVSVKVNGTTYSHTFTTGGFKVSKRDSTHMYIYCGNTCIGLWSV